MPWGCLRGALVVPQIFQVPERCVRGALEVPWRCLRVVLEELYRSLRCISDALVVTWRCPRCASEAPGALRGASERP